RLLPDSRSPPRERAMAYLSAVAGDLHADDSRRTRVRVPLRLPSGTIGEIEVVDPRERRSGAGDTELLEELANAVAVASRRASPPGRGADDALGFHTLGGAAGFGLGAVGPLILLRLLS